LLLLAGGCARQQAAPQQWPAAELHGQRRIGFGAAALSRAAALAMPPTATPHAHTFDVNRLAAVAPATIQRQMRQRTYMMPTR
jgi:hypothetical protein